MLLDCLESRTANTRPGCFSIPVHARLPEDRHSTQLTNVLTLSDMIPIGLLGLPRVIQDYQLPVTDDSKFSCCSELSAIGNFTDVNLLLVFTLEEIALKVVD